MKKKNLLILGAAVMLSACSASELGLLSGNESPNWRPYKDIDESTQYMSFISETTVYAEQHSEEIRTDSVGRAYKKGSANNEILVGYLFNIYDANQVAMASYFGTSTDKNLNPHDKQSMAKATKAKKLDFYEFGKGRLGHAEFTANKGLCADFNSKNGIKIKMATNYYQNYENYYTSLVSAVISKQEIKDVNYKPLLSGSQAFISENSQQEAQNGRKLAMANLQEKATLFTNIICR